MKLTGNTILITGGGTGIGRGLAEAFHRLGNNVIITGRREAPLRETAEANPGMKFATLDVEDEQAVADFVKRAKSEYPALNVLVNNAGIMRPETVPSADVSDAAAIITTNLLAPIRLTNALLPQLQSQPDPAVLMVSSGLAFLPLAFTPTYCATKAAIHSYAMSLRFQLREKGIGVIELIPPYVQTHLTGEHQASDPMAMPLDEYISETMSLLEADPNRHEVQVERVKPLRHAPAADDFEQRFTEFNAQMAGRFNG